MQIHDVSVKIIIKYDNIQGSVLKLSLYCLHDVYACTELRVNCQQSQILDSLINNSPTLF